MINILCTICARKGSKGLVKKNVRPLMGVPLIAHSIKQAKETGIFDVIAVSSDDPDILDIAREYGADMVIDRPLELASDFAAKVPVICHAVLEAEKITGSKYNILVDIDATSPLRTPEDIIACVNLLNTKKSSNVITGCLSHRSPYFNMVECDKFGNTQLVKKLNKNIVRRQDAPLCYDMNASIYVWNREKFDKEPKLFYPDTQLYVMPRERSWDIDSDLDFSIVEMIMKNKRD